MANLSLRRHDTQARVSVIISGVAVFFLLIMAALMFGADQGFRHVDTSDLSIAYGATRYRVVLLTAAFTLLLAAIGFGMGLSSAGQRRNDRPGLSWLGFFIGAGVICLTIILLFLLRARGDLMS